MPPSLWTQDFMDEMRTKMDPLADAVIERLFTEHQVEGVNRLMRTLVENDDLPSDRLPPYVVEYLIRTQGEVQRLDAEKLRQGQELFELFGPEVMLILGFYSLPASYAARKGVQVLHRTGFLQKRFIRRVFETAQMVVDVMTEGGMEPDGRGVRTTQKVRLMHAAIRYMIRHDPNKPWDEQELGQPINQEDLAGTLMTFGFVVLEGMKALRIDLTPAQQEAWLYVWRAVGRIIGVDERLIPANMAEARELTFLIRKRQVAYSKEGVAMTAALIEGFQQLTPDILDGLPASMVHFFLDQDQWQGINVAKLLEVPRPDWTVIIPHAIKGISEVVDWVGDNTFVAARLLRYVSKDIVEGMLLVERGGQRTPFFIPDRLQDLWRLKPGTRSADRRTASHQKVA
jgi:hypothetical protein